MSTTSSTENYLEKHANGFSPLGSARAKLQWALDEGKVDVPLAVWDIKALLFATTELPSRVAELTGDLEECKAGNKQARDICDAVAAALGEDLDHDAGSAVSVTRLRARLQDVETQLAAAIAALNKKV